MNGIRGRSTPSTRHKSQNVVIPGVRRTRTSIARLVPELDDSPWGVNGRYELMIPRSGMRSPVKRRGKAENPNGSHLNSNTQGHDEGIQKVIAPQLWDSPQD